MISEKRALHELGSCTFVISVKRAFKIYLFACVFDFTKIVKIA